MEGKNKHFTYEDRVINQQSLNKLSFKEIAKKLNKDCSSVSREVRRHTVTVHTGSWDKRYNILAKRDQCSASRLCKLITYSRISDFLGVSIS